MTLSPEDLAERAHVAAEAERLRAPIIELWEAVRDMRLRQDDLEWALWATDPEEIREDFNQEYADERLLDAIPKFHAAVKRVEEVLDEHGWSAGR